MSVKSSAILILTLSLFLVLSFKDLSILPTGLYWDEMDVGYQANSLLKTGRDYFNNPLPLFPHSFADYRTPVLVYSSVPFVAKLGLSALSVRLPALLWSLLGLLAFYVLTRTIFPTISQLPSLVSPILLAFSPWYFQFSRIGFEITSLLTLFCLAVAAFLRSFKNPSWLPFSALFFVLSAYAYSPGKFLAPLMVLLLSCLYFRQLIDFPKKNMVISFVLLLPYIFTLSGSSNSRFHDLAVFTDPQTSSQVNYLRQQFDLAHISAPVVGLKSSLLGKLVINKPLQWFRAIEANYLSAFSTEFLFTKGDPQLRHNPGKDQIGEFSPVLFLLIIVGLISVFTIDIKFKNKNLKLILVWLLLAPLPAALTRDGAMHSSRLSLLLPPLILLAILGISFIIRKSKFAFLGLSVIFFFTTFSFLAYYFGPYRTESAVPFQSGFSQLVRIAQKQSANYDQVFIDTGNDSALMAYLFTTNISPIAFHQLLPLEPTTYASQLTGFEFGNIMLLSPGSRNWSKLATETALQGKNILVLAASNQPQADQIRSVQQTLLYPDFSTAFYVFKL